jgi:hypothetical protein
MSNASDSRANVVSTVVLVIEQFISGIQIEIPDVKLVYDEKLSYETAVTKLRADQNSDLDHKNTYPLFAFRRSVLRHAKDGVGRRGISDRQKHTIDETKVKIFRSVYGEFDIDFLYITKSTEDLERFEIAYLCDESFSGNKELRVNFDEALGGYLPYFQTPGDLQDKTFEDSGNHYKMIQGQTTLRGFYPVLTGTSPVILSIRARILSFLETIAASHLMTEISVTAG